MSSSPSRSARDDVLLSDSFTGDGWANSFIQLCASHPEKARWTFNVATSETLPTLHYLVREKRWAPHAVFHAVIEAFPADTIMQDQNGCTPLHHIVNNLVSPSTLELFELLFQASQKEALSPLASAFPQLPPGVFREHVIPYMENPLLMTQDSNGFTILHTMFGTPAEILSPEAEYVRVKVLKASPQLASVRDSYENTALLYAVRNEAPLGELQLLVDSFPEALTLVGQQDGTTPFSEFALALDMMRAGTIPLLEFMEASKWMERKVGITPLVEYLNRDQEIDFDKLKLLAETRPQAVLIRNSFGQLPYQLIGNPESNERLYLQRLTEEQLRFSQMPAERE